MKKILFPVAASLLLIVAILIVFQYKEYPSDPDPLQTVSDTTVIFQAFNELRPQLDAVRAYLCKEKYIVLAITRQGVVSSNVQLVATVMNLDGGGKGEVLAETMCDLPMTPGFSAGISRIGDSAIIFGALSDSFGILSDDAITKVPFENIEIRVIYEDGHTTSTRSDKNSYYVIAIDSNTMVKDIQYIKDETIITCFSDYFGSME